MAKVQNLSEIEQSLAFTEFDFYELYLRQFDQTELGRIKKLLPLGELAEKFGLVEKKGMRSLRVKRGRKSYFTPEGKVALMFLKMYTGMSAPKLMEALNANIYMQIFCGIRINPAAPLTNYNIMIDRVSFIEKLSFNPFNEGPRLRHCISLAKRLLDVKITKIGEEHGEERTCQS